MEFCPTKDMLLFLKVEIKCCIVRLEVGQGYIGFGRSGYEKGQNMEPKQKPNERAPSNQSVALGPHEIVQPKGVCHRLRPGLCY